MSSPTARLQIVASIPKRVTFFEDRAEVVRHASVDISSRPEWVQVTGVTPYLDDSSIQAKVEAPARVLAARVRRRVTLQSDLGREDISAVEEAERRARERVQQADRTAERCRISRERLAVMFADWGRSLARVPVGAAGGKIDDWRKSYRALEAKLAAALSAEAEAALAQQDARDELSRTSTRLAQVQTTRPVCEAVVEVQIMREPAESSATGGPEQGSPDSAGCDLEIAYRTPCALWRPEHLARLVLDNDDAKVGTIEITTWATAWQSTGEDWAAIAPCFSTARPAKSASPPLLQPDLIMLRRKSDEERHTVQVESRDQIIAKTESGEGARSVDEMPGVDDGGLPLAFTPDGQVTMPSHGRPFRVEIGRAVLDARIGRVLLPEAAPVAHYQATATLTGKTPLLAGPVRIVRGSALVGRGRLGYVASGEPFTLGFGLDDNLRLRRTVETRREQSAISGTQRIEHTVRLYLSNLSDAERGVTIQERIPVSEIADVQVALLEAEGFKHRPDDGFLTAEIVVGPRETRELRLKHEIRAKPNVRLG